MCTHIFTLKARMLACQQLVAAQPFTAVLQTLSFARLSRACEQNLRAARYERSTLSRRTEAQRLARCQAFARKLNVYGGRDHDYKLFAAAV